MSVSRTRIDVPVDIANELEKFINTIFNLIPKEKRQNKHAGVLLGYPIAPFKYRTLQELANDKSYPIHAVCAMHDALVLIKKSGVLTCPNWNKKTSAGKAIYAGWNLGKSFNILLPCLHSMDGMSYSYRSEKIKVINEIIKFNHEKWVENGEFKALTLTEMPNEIMLTLPGKPSESLHAQHSWMPHIVDELTYNIAITFKDFILTILKSRDVPERQELSDKLRQIEFRLKVYELLLLEKKSHQQTVNSTHDTLEKLQQYRAALKQRIDHSRLKMQDLKTNNIVRIYSNAITKYDEEIKILRNKIDIRDQFIIECHELMGFFLKPLDEIDKKLSCIKQYCRNSSMRDLLCKQRKIIYKAKSIIIDQIESAQNNPKMLDLMPIIETIKKQMKDLSKNKVFKVSFRDLFYSYYLKACLIAYKTLGLSTNKACAKITLYDSKMALSLYSQRIAFFGERNVKTCQQRTKSVESYPRKLTIP